MQRSSTLLSAAVGAALFAFASHGYGQAQGLEVKLSGQVNRAILHADDGGESDTFFVDNDNSSTRLRISATAPVRPGLRAGAVFEVEYQSNASNEVNFLTQDVSPEFNERHLDVFFDGGWGKVSLGQGDGAANGAVEVDLSGTTVAHYADIGAIGGAFAFRGTDGVLTGATVAGTTSQQDFESRYDRVRYDTPSFGGFRIAGSMGSKDNGRDVTELALWYSGKLGAFGELAGALGYSSQDAAPGGIDDEVVGGSLSWLHSSGINLTVGHTERDLPNRDGEFNYVKVGYKFGNHAVSLDYGMGDDQAAAGDEATATGVGYVYKVASWAELYAAYRTHSLDRPGASLNDIDFFMVGTRVKF